LGYKIWNFWRAGCGGIGILGFLTDEGDSYFDWWGYSKTI